MNKNSIPPPALRISPGIEQPSPVNKEAAERIRSARKKNPAPEYYIEGILAGNRTILSQAITIIESNLESHRRTAAHIIEDCLPYSGKSIRIGITGVPGVGKSTFIEALGLHVTSHGKKIAVLAVDPSSDRSGGSILGDKTRMEILSSLPSAFIRPSPSGGTLGGVARKTRETIILCEAAGFDTLIIETVGVGQSETAVHSMVDFFLLLMLAGAGDELQGIKRGIMEMADLIAINKADGSNIGKARQAQSEYRSALRLFPPLVSGWEPQVLTCSARQNEGIDEIWAAIERYRNSTLQNGYFFGNRTGQARYWMHETLNEQLKHHFYNNPHIKKHIKELEKKVLENSLSPFHAAGEILQLYKQGVEKK